MNKDKFVVPFHGDAFPAWTCGGCNDGTLSLLQLVKKETTETAKNRVHEGWDPTWDKYRFFAKFKCSRCGDVTFAIGNTVTVIVRNDEYGEVASELHTPEFFIPSIPLIFIPDNCPVEVGAEVERAFSLFWCDYEACLNKLRTCIELILNSKSVKKFEIKGKRRKYISLHRRIEIFRDREKEIAEKMLAVKWLGNAGSHAPKVSDDYNLLDGFELIESIIEELYERKTKRIAKIARNINRKKGPV